MSTMTHKFKVLKRYFILYFRETTVFKSELLISILDFFITIFSTIIFWISIRGIGIKFNCWNVEYITIIVGFNFISIATNSIFFGFRDLEYKIISGDFDLIMTKAQSPFFILILSRMNFLYIILNLIMGIFTMSYGLIIYNISIKYLFWTILVCFFSSISLAIFYAIFSLLAFKIGRIYYIRELFFSFLDVKEYPIDIFPKSIYNFFTYIIPLSLISTIPTKIVFDKVNYSIFVFLSLFFFLLMLILFKILSKKAIRLYSSTGN